MTLSAYGWIPPVAMNLTTVFIYFNVCLFIWLCQISGFPWGLRQLRIHLQCRRPGFDHWVGKIP